MGLSNDEVGPYRTASPPPEVVEYTHVVDWRKRAAGVWVALHGLVAYAALWVWLALDLSNGLAWALVGLLHGTSVLLAGAYFAHRMEGQ